MEPALPTATAEYEESAKLPLRLLQRLGGHQVWLAALVAAAILIPGIGSYTLVDPWETHYGEVARGMLEDEDWVHLRWQGEDFKSKPALTFWLMASGLKVFGLAESGGYSGELATSPTTSMALRLPFVLCGIIGLTLLWWMLASLVSIRTAWISHFVLISTPFYFFVARQGITDMPMVMCLMGSVACFAMAIHKSDESLVPIWRRLNSYHLFCFFLALFVGVQLVYYTGYFAQHSPGGGWSWPLHGSAVLPFALLLAFFLAITNGFRALPDSLRQKLPPSVAQFLHVRPIETRAQVHMLWLYFLAGLSVLGKGPPALAITGAVCFFFILLTNRWRLLARIELFRGLLVAILVALPWHVAIFLRQGYQWVNEYLRLHILQRAFRGVHGDRGTFDYYASQIGIGMWPWAALVPAALATVLVARLHRVQEQSVRTLVATWALVAVALFSAVQTKFHHYILPAVPALAMLVAFYLDDLWTGRVKRVGMAVVTAMALLVLIARDLVGEQKQFIELFVYRYDRAWPSAAPWSVDVGVPLILAAGAVFVWLLVLLWPRMRRWGVIGILATSLLFALWGMSGYMGRAAPHWGQRDLHRTYYENRTIHGVDIRYFSLRDAWDDWSGEDEYPVRTVIPATLQVGAPVKAIIHLPGAQLPNDRIEVPATVTRIGDDVFWMRAHGSQVALAPIAERAAKAAPSSRKPEMQVNADRLVAWQLNWRGENFWSNGEIYGPFDSTKTVHKNTDNKSFLEYLEKHGVPRQRYFVITEASRARNLKNILPNERAKDSVETEDTSCNKFTLMSFTL